MEEKTEFSNLLELMNALARAENTFKNCKLIYEFSHNNLLLQTNWDDINETREKQGLPKISNLDMKNAYIETNLKDIKKDLSIYEREYLDLKRKYDVALKFSFEILKVSQ